jgi:PKD repeat protein
MDYGDFRGLILRVAPGTLRDYVSPADDPFGLLALRGDFDCRDQRRLPYCHPDLVGNDWFTTPTSLADVEFVTVHQPGNAATVMNFNENFGLILSMAGFIPTAEFYQGSTQLQVKGAYAVLPGGGTTEPPPPPPPPPANVAPTADFSFSCANLTCAFTDQSSDTDGTVVGWSWNFGDGTASTAQNPSRTYAAAGTYVVTLTVTDDDGASSLSTSKTVTVTAPVAITLTASGTKVRGVKYANLSWSGAGTSTVDIYRDGAFIRNTASKSDGTGTYVDGPLGRGGGSNTYRLCNAGSTTACSNNATVNW